MFWTNTYGKQEHKDATAGNQTPAVQQTAHRYID
jgi:hypothetical protein